MNQQFKENYHGILSHDGWVKVAKFNITATINHILKNKIFVRGVNGKGTLHCEVHKNLSKDIKFMNKGDQVGIKWNCGKPYVVAYRKKDYDKTKHIETGDHAVSENMDWITFFKKMEME